MAKVMAVTNQKGGPGKTSTAVNLSFELAEQGHKTLLVDLDPQANATKVISAANYNHEITTAEVLGKSPPPIQDAIKQSPYHHNAYYIPAALRLMSSLQLLMTRSYRETVLQKQLATVKGFDYIIIDTQPNADIGTQNAIVAAEHLIIPIDGGFSLDGLSDLLRLVNEFKAGSNYHYWILKNRFNASKTIMANFIDEELRGQHAEHVLNTVIRQNEPVELSSTSAMPVKVYQPKARAVSDYTALANEMKEKIHG